MNRELLELLFIVVSTFSWIGYTDHLVNTLNDVKAKSEKLELQVAEVNKINAEKDEMVEYTLKTMDIVRSPLKEFQRKLLANKIADVTVRRLSTKERREAYIVLLSIESKFESKAKSTVGAVGIGQVMPKYASEHAVDCGMGDFKVTSEDLLDTDTNLNISACHFNYLIDQVGNVPQALAAYNAGLNSATTKKLGSLETINDETANYIAKFAYVTEMNRK